MRKSLTPALIALVSALAVTGCGGVNHNGQTHRVSKPSVSASASYGGRTHSAQFLDQVQHAVLPPSRPTLSLSSTLAGCDSVTISNCGAIAHQALGCYAPGTTFANCPTAAADFPTAKLASIATHTNFNGKVLDTEPGDATPSEDPSWVRAMWAHEARPAVYASLSEMQEPGGVIAEMSAAGIPHCTTTVTTHCYLRWVAAWDGNPAIPAGYDAKQWNSNAQVDFDSFSPGFFSTPRPPKPRTICWGKGSTPKSSVCVTIRQRAKHDWEQYTAFHSGLVLHLKEEKPVQGRINALSQTKMNISVPGYKGLSLGYLRGRVTEETHNADLNKSKHDALVKKYHSGTSLQFTAFERRRTRCNRRCQAEAAAKAVVAGIV